MIGNRVDVIINVEADLHESAPAGWQRGWENTLVKRPNTHDTRKKTHEINRYFRGRYIRVKCRP